MSSSTITKVERSKYNEYLVLMAQHSIIPRSINDWVAVYRSQNRPKKGRARKTKEAAQ